MIANFDVKWVTRQTVRLSFGMLHPIMQDLLQHIDLNYYRSAQLLIVHAELAHLRQERSASADVERRTSPRIDNESGDVGIIDRRVAQLAE